jgi:hypothetical protein
MCQAPTNLITVFKNSNEVNTIESFRNKKNTVYCVHMYVNGKMRPVETTPGMVRRKIKNDGRGEFKYDISDIL